MPNRYLPFLNGIYSTSPGLQLLAKGETTEDRKIFQIDENYTEYLANKDLCRNEYLGKYYLEKNLDKEVAVTVNKYLAQQLLLEHPAIFSLTKIGENYSLQNKLTAEILEWTTDWTKIKNPKYISLFDGLCCQVQEDVAVCQLTENADWLASIHLCAPNHWAASDKIGKPFNAIHGEIPGMEKTLHHNHKMLEALVQKGPYTRFAWGLATDNRLNHHPEAPQNQDPETWRGRRIQDKNTPLFVRVERQNTVGFPALNAFLFTIRTYFYAVESLPKSEKLALLKGIESMSPESLKYKGLTGCLPILKEALQ